jgi:type II secretory pathway pseudopilin PulG
VETLLTLGIIAVTAGVTIPMYRNYQLRSDLDLTAEQVLQALRSAQGRSQAGENDAQWGFYVADGVLFEGDAYALRDTDEDEQYPFPDTISTSGLSEVVFSRVNGIPNNTGDIILETISGEQRIITVSADGTLSSSGIQPSGLDSDADDVDGADSTGDSDADGDTDGDSDGADSDSDDDADGDGDGDDADGDDDSDGDGDGDDSDGDDDGGGTGDVDSDSDGDDADGDGADGDDADDGDSDSDGDDDEGDDDEDEEEEVTCEDRFLVQENGTIETTGSVDVTFKVLGSAITYGSGGPEVQVRVDASVDGGATWTDLYNDNDVDGGETQTIQNLPSGAQVLLRVNGRYSVLFNQTYRSNDGTGHIEVLRDGDDTPAYAPFGNQGSLKNFLKEIVGEDGNINIGEFDAVALVELGTLNSSSSDFQDAVILVQFAEKPNSCVTTGPRFKVAFNRLENVSNGNAARSVYVGNNPAVRFGESQWIPLRINGATVIDPGLTEDVPGLSVERKNGVVRILSHGTHTGTSKEIVDATITFANAVITGITNDTGDNASEDPFNGVVNDGSGGDEVTSGDTSALFQTRVTSSDDAILIAWQQQASAPPPSQEDDDDEDDEEDEGTPDACTAAFAIQADGSILLQEAADVSFRVRGSHATYGSRGPEVQVHLNASFNAGSSWHSLFKFRDVDGGELQTFSDVAAGSKIVLAAEGRYGWLFRETSHSRDGSGRIKFLKNGDAVPTTSAYTNQSGLKNFVRNVIRNGKISTESSYVIALVELQNLDDASDYQDAVVEIIIQKPESQGICGAPGSEDDEDNDENNDEDDEDQGDGDEDNDGVPDPDLQISICHYPPGNRRNPETLQVGQSAWSAHSAHGDRMGACDADSDGDQVPNNRDLCSNTYVPEHTPTEFMLFDRYALTSTSFIFREGPRKRVSNYTLDDTRGCSCEQLIDVAENVKAYYFDQYPSLQRKMRSLFPFFTNGARKNGCSEAVLKMVKNNAQE